MRAAMLRRYLIPHAEYRISLSAAIRAERTTWASGRSASFAICTSDDVCNPIGINPELTVHLYRYPTTEWVCLEAATCIDSDGIGLAYTKLHDEKGPIGRGSQSLYVARQPSG